MSVFNMYPYLDFHEMNLDYVLRLVAEMKRIIDTFVSTNAIKYADPFQWNITTQYEKNTVVMDANSGIAYLSVQPVPAGIGISNSDYWTPVFDLSQLFTGFNKNLTNNDEMLNIYSSANYSVGDWLVWKNELYEVTSPINIGDILNPGVNISRITIESVIDGIMSVLNAVNAEVNKRVPVYDSISIMKNADLAANDKCITAMNSCIVNYTVKMAPSSNDYSILLNNGLYACVDHEEVNVKGLIENLNAGCSALVNDLISKAYPIFFDHGQFYVNISTPSGMYVNIRGCGIASILEPESNAPIISVTNGLYVFIKDLKIQNNIHFASWTSVSGLKINGASKCIFENLVIEGCHGAVFSRGGCLWNTFKNVRAYGTVGIGFRFEAIASGDQINNNNFIACEMTKCTTFGWYFQDNHTLSFGNNVIGCTCEESGTQVGTFPGDHTTQAVILSGVNVNFDGCYFEACDNVALVRATFRFVMKNCSLLGITCPLFELIGSYDQAVFECNNGYSVTGALYSGGSGTLTRVAYNVGLPS